MSEATTIGLVDDDPGMLRAVGRLLKTKGYAVCAFAGPDEFLAGFAQAGLGCVVLDVAMPGLDGLALHEHLKRKGVRLPIIFLTGEGDIPMSVRAIKAGAVNFLTKPVEHDALLGAVRAALAEGAQARAEADALHDLRARAAELTARELEVLRHVIAGTINKQIAAALGIAEQTVKVHRMRISEKMGIASVAELVRATALLEITPAKSQ